MRIFSGTLCIVSVLALNCSVVAAQVSGGTPSAAMDEFMSSLSEEQALSLSDAI
jgi:hypothetical protein